MADFAPKSSFNTLNSVIIITFNNCSENFDDRNETDETLMNKGFQRISKKAKSKTRSLNQFTFLESLSNRWWKTIVLIHKQIKNVNKILYKIFLVRKNYF